jgi:hypothetical protein
LSGQDATLVNQGLNDIRSWAPLACGGAIVGVIATGGDPSMALSTLGVCSLAAAPYAGYFATSLTSLYDTLNTINNL